MKLPLVSRKKHQELQEAFAQENLNNRVLATKLHAIQVICDRHNDGKMGNLRMTRMVKEVVDKI